MVKVMFKGRANYQVKVKDEFKVMANEKAKSMITVHVVMEVKVNVNVKLK